MSTLEVALARIQALEARVNALEGARGGSSSSSSSSGDIPRVEPLPDRMLDNSWADKKIDRDPKKWKGRTQVGRHWSQAPAEWLELAASSMEYKAEMGRREPSPRLQTTGKNAGKPWHEADTFNAKILRAWAKRNASKPKPAPKQDQADDDWGAAPAAAADDFGDYAGGADDDIPFAFDATIYGRWDRP